MSEATAIVDPKESRTVVVGVRPWLPWPLSRSQWWNRPVPAERLAALRIAMAVALIFDILCTYLPHAQTFFGAGSVGRREVSQSAFRHAVTWHTVVDDLTNLGTDLTEGRPLHRTFDHRWRWSLLAEVEDSTIIRAAMIAWLVAACLLALGLGTRFAAVTVWFLSTSFASVNTYIDNAGDQVRYIVTLYLMVAPAGAAWSLDAWLRRRWGRLHGRVLIYPWALRLLFIQMILIYWCNGLYKATGAEWVEGSSLYYVLGDLTLTRWSYAEFPIPYPLTRLLSWAVLVWEVGFPLWVCLPWRWFGERAEGWCGPRLECLPWLLGHVPVIALAFGVAFHLGIGLSMELGFFVPYMLCLYVPLLPLERLSWRGRVM